MNKTQLVTLVVALGAAFLGFLIYAAVVNQSMRHAYYVESQAREFAREMISSTNSIEPDFRPMLAELAAAPVGVEYVQITGSNGFFSPKRSWVRLDLTNAVGAKIAVWLEYTARSDTFKLRQAERTFPSTTNAESRLPSTVNSP